MIKAQIRPQPSQRSEKTITSDQMRRSGELLLACILLALTLPLMVIVALAIKCESTGPVLERRARVGNGGRAFQILSFRTTVQRSGRLRSTRQTTQIDHFLQSTRIDALPQLLNVLRGEMSINDTALFE
jgi:lipopolysaccharide/colanic/teichoic acid biosynthesis glycosyltransferase